MSNAIAAIRDFWAAQGDNVRGPSRTVVHEVLKAWFEPEVRIDPKSSAEIEPAFQALRDQWRNDTQLTSSLPETIGHPAYLRIIALGWPGVPLIMRELRQEPDHWHSALQAITHQDPVPEEHAGDLEALAADWLAWAHRCIRLG